jgi:hypothetical protein
MIAIQNYEKVANITSDGDFGCLIKHLNNIGELERVLSPFLARSALLRMVAQTQIDFLDNLRPKLGYI